MKSKVKTKEEKDDWMATLPNRPTQEDEWFSEHDFRLEDDFDYERGPSNEVVGMRVGGVQYFRSL